MSTDARIDHLDEAPEPASEPYAAREIGAAFLRPHRAIELILARRDRWTSTVVDGRQLGALVALMMLASGLFAVPYGLVLGVDQLWRVAAMFLGSALICFPSLHVFSAFLALRVDLGQNLALALLITSVAAIFSFGFFPILWFFEVTMSGDGSIGTRHGLSVFLLITALGAGILQICRCLFRERRLRPKGSFWFWVLIFFWQGLLIFITCRMGIFLGLI